MGRQVDERPDPLHHQRRRAVASHGPRARQCHLLQGQVPQDGFTYLVVEAQLRQGHDGVLRKLGLKEAFDLGKAGFSDMHGGGQRGREGEAHARPSSR
jgi:hypothetical protein